MGFSFRQLLRYFSGDLEDIFTEKSAGNTKSSQPFCDKVPESEVKVSSDLLWVLLQGGEPGWDTPKFKHRSWMRKVRSEQKHCGRWKKISCGETVKAILQCWGQPWAPQDERDIEGVERVQGIVGSDDLGGFSHLNNSAILWAGAILTAGAAVQMQMSSSCSCPVLFMLNQLSPWQRFVAPSTWDAFSLESVQPSWTSYTYIHIGVCVCAHIFTVISRL